MYPSINDVASFCSLLINYKSIIINMFFFSNTLGSTRFSIIKKIIVKTLTWPHT